MVMNTNSTPQEHSANLEIGVDQCLHLEVEYENTRLHLNDILKGKIRFAKNKLRISNMFAQFLRREDLYPVNGCEIDKMVETKVLGSYEIMEGWPEDGEVIPISVPLAQFQLTPTLQSRYVDKRFYVNIVLIDEDGRRYFKHSEIYLYRNSIPFEIGTKNSESDYEMEAEDENLLAQNNNNQVPQNPAEALANQILPTINDFLSTSAATDDEVINQNNNKNLNSQTNSNDKNKYVITRDNGQTVNEERPAMLKKKLSPSSSSLGKIIAKPSTSQESSANSSSIMTPNKSKLKIKKNSNMTKTIDKLQLKNKKNIIISSGNDDQRIMERKNSQPTTIMLSSGDEEEFQPDTSTTTDFITFEKNLLQDSEFDHVKHKTHNRIFERFDTESHPLS